MRVQCRGNRLWENALRQNAAGIDCGRMPYARMRRISEGSKSPREGLQNCGPDLCCVTINLIACLVLRGCVQNKLVWHLANKFREECEYIRTLSLLSVLRGLELGSEWSFHNHFGSSRNIRRNVLKRYQTHMIAELR